MSFTVPMALYGFVAAVAILFAALPPRRAVLAAYFAGWMFLPEASLELFGFFDWSKRTAIPLAVFGGMLAFDSARVFSLRLRWFDLPIAAFCAVPLATSLANGLGWYDGLSGAMYQSITWGLPYWTGRAYFGSASGARELAIAMVAGGLVYMPLCLWEIRMSPQLHATLYGFHQHEWVQTLRGGGFRPMVFMQHGLMVGMWMCAASLVALALWSSGAQRKLWGIPLAWIAVALAVTTVLCKSFGAVGLLSLGAATLAALRFGRTSLAMAALLLIPMVYVGARVSGSWAGEGMISAVAEVSEARAGSLAYRIGAEERLRAKAVEKPLLGWGGWNRSLSLQFDEPGRAGLTRIDSLWIIVFGKHGFVGLASLLACFLAPVLVLWKLCPPRSWSGPVAAWPWALAIVLSLYALDCMVNAMQNPVYLVMAGALCGLAPAVQVERPRRAVVPARRRALAGAGAP